MDLRTLTNGCAFSAKDYMRDLIDKAEKKMHISAGTGAAGGTWQGIGRTGDPIYCSLELSGSLIGPTPFGILNKH